MEPCFFQIGDETFLLDFTFLTFLIGGIGVGITTQIHSHTVVIVFYDNVIVIVGIYWVRSTGIFYHEFFFDYSIQYLITMSWVFYWDVFLTDCNS